MARTVLQGQGETKKIVIVDDHPVMRLGLTALIDAEPELTVCGEASTARSALSVIRKSQPDLVIVDLMLKGLSGLDVVKKMKTRHPEIPSLILSMHDESVYAERALRAGASGYVTKQQLDDTVLKAIRCVLDGGKYMSKAVQAKLAEKFLGGQTLQNNSPLDALSDRELEVFRMIGEGRSTRQVAKRLSLSIKTIESHQEHIKQKLTLSSSTELVHRAIEWVESGR
jgi:DNA-binding NarL/FixJ family response regulator